MNLDIAAVVKTRGFPARLETDLVRVLEANVAKPARSKRRKAIIGDKTQISRIYGIVGLFDDLRELGFHIQTVDNLRKDHVEALHGYWVTRGLSAGRIAGLNSHLRTLGAWLQKRNLVAPVAELVPGFHRPTVARVDKSWSAKALDIEAILVTVRECDKHGRVVAMQLELECVMGLRANEAWLLKPFPAWLEAVNRAAVMVSDGTKGGRPRDLQLDLPMQLEVLGRACSFMKSAASSTIPAAFALPQWSQHYYYVLRKAKIIKNQDKGGLGVTGHGLRHEFLQGLYRRLTGHAPPIKGGLDVPVSEYRAALRVVIEAAGHSDVGKTGAYLSTVSAMRRHLEKLAKLCNDAIPPVAQDNGGT